MTLNRGMGPSWGAFCQITLTSCCSSRDISTSGLGGHIAISGCRSLSQWLRNTFFDVDVVGKLDFVTWVTAILIPDLFCHSSQHDHKIYKFKKSLVFDVMPNNFPCTDWRPDCCIFYPLHIQEKPLKDNAQRWIDFFSYSKTELGAFFTPKRNRRVKDTAIVTMEGE